MKTIAVLKNTIQEYAWGSYTAIPELLGQTPSGNPQAELWMGAHPKAPSIVEYQGREVSLSELIEKYPEEILGKTAADKFGRQLPYLFKILAAAKPLSIQAHPDKAHAVEGFERENSSGIPLNAPNRSYKDANHKPECLCAITQFWGLKGFRRIPEIISLINMICGKELKRELDILNSTQTPNDVLMWFLYSLMTLEPERKKQIIEAAVAESEKRLGERRAFRWIIDLYEDYPEDIGILSPLFLNIICLDPGQAIFLPSGEPHAYLDGTGIELMANSDNVLRGGLTPKYIDVPELMKVLKFEESDVSVLEPEPVSDVESIYSCGAEEFLLSVISMKKKEAAFPVQSAQILLCAEGSAKITTAHQSLSVKKGMSLLVPAAAGQYKIKGNAVFYKASVPIQKS